MGGEGENERKQVRKEEEEGDGKGGIKQESSHLGGNPTPLWDVMRLKWDDIYAQSGGCHMTPD